jgi:APA family basic amino acid/polyamine antiporter
MIGAGVFAAVGPAAEAAGAALLYGLLLAGGVAFCNAMSSAALARLYPASGGTYVYGRERLGRFWGYLAGWAFVIGKLASLAVMALTFGTYAAPELARPLAVAAVVVITGVNYRGVTKTARLARVIVVLVLLSLFAIVVGSLGGGEADFSNIRNDLSDPSPLGVFQSAGLLFFAFAGYARIATLGEEVRDPERTIPRAIPLALGITLVIYAAVYISGLLSAGPDKLADATAPLATSVSSGNLSWLAPAARVGAAIASLGVLLSLIAGVSRTVFAMAANREMPTALAAVHPRFRVPHRAELAVAAVVAVLATTTDLRSVISFSSFAVLVYYAITNASAWTLPRTKLLWPRLFSGIGFVGCLALAFSLPLFAVAIGAGVLGAGAAVYFIVLRRVGRE